MKAYVQKYTKLVSNRKQNSSIKNVWKPVGLHTKEFVGT